MSEKKIEDIVFDISSPISEKNNCEVVDVEFKKEGPDWFLRVYIDKEGGITLDDCEAVSRELSDELDRVDPISQAYYLEISSPGINRPLKRERDFQRFIGHNIDIKLFKPLDGTKKLNGILVDYKDSVISIECEAGNILKVDKKDCAKINLADV